MTTVYLIRHGETANNQEKRCNGCRTNQPLNERGEAQARALSAYFSDHPVDTVHTSYLDRAKQTAMLAFGLDESALLVEPDLHEVDVGLWDGMLFPEIAEKYPEQWYNNKHRTSLAVYPEGEAIPDAAERVFGAFLRIVRENRGKRIAIVAHGLALALLCQRIFSWHLDRKNEMAGLSNTGFHLLEIDEKGHAEMMVWNCTDHLNTELWSKAPYSTDVESVAAECRGGANLPL